MVTRSRMCAAAMIGLAGAPALAQDGFNYTDFSSTTNLNFVSSAAQNGNRVALTPDAGRTKGAMWHQFRQDVAGGFQTQFAFSVDNINRGGADGFAFVIQNVANNVIGGDGGALGYGDNPLFGGVGIVNSLAVEFDMWDNTFDWQDVDGNHVSIQSRGTLPNTPVHGLGTMGAMPLPSGSTDLNDGGIHTALITYTPGLRGVGAAGTLTVYVDDLLNPVLQTSINLETLLSLDGGTDAFVGITAATGNVLDAQRHLVHNWSFTSVIPAPGAVSLLGAAGALALRRRRPAR